MRNAVANGSGSGGNGKPDIPEMPLSEMAAAVTPKRGLECPMCGCRDMRVQTTRQQDNMIIRYRVCRNCGYHRPTIES